MTVSQLEQWNNISNPNYLYVGQTLNIYTNGSGYQGGYLYTAPTNLVDFTASYEGFSSTPYWDVDGWAVGFGQNYGSYYPGNVTYQQALNILRNSLSICMREVEALTRGCNLNQNQINALTDFVYNLGINSLKNSQLLVDIRNGNTNPTTITQDFQAWSYADGSFLVGLYYRRTAEAQMFLYNQYNDR